MADDSDQRLRIARRRASTVTATAALMGGVVMRAVEPDELPPGEWPRADGSVIYDARGTTTVAPASEWEILGRGGRVIMRGSA